MKNILLWLIEKYQRVSFITRYAGVGCRFYPTCSTYMYEAISKYGAWRGGSMGIRRILRCHPWHPGGVDKVP